MQFIAQIFHPKAELMIPIGIPTKRAKSEMETHPVIVEPRIRRCSIRFRVVQNFLWFLLILFHLFF